MEIRPLEEAFRDWAVDLVALHFGSARIVSRGVLHDASSLSGLVALRDLQPVGLLLYRLDAGDCELVLLVSVQPCQGVGTALLQACHNRAVEAGCQRLWLVTTNDNLHAQDFYTARGLRQSAVYLGAVRQSRQLKPEIPLFGQDGTLIEDEIEFELPLARA